MAPNKDRGAQFSFYVATRRGSKPDTEPEWLAQLSGRMANSLRTANNTSQVPAMDSTPPSNSLGARRPSAVTGFRVLVVEDNVINQRVLKKQLEARGCVVLVIPWLQCLWYPTDSRQVYCKQRTGGGRLHSEITVGEAFGIRCAWGRDMPHGSL